MINPINLKNSAVQSQANPSVIRVIRWYEKKGDRLAGETTLENASLSELQTLFNQSSDDPMYDCYPVLPSHVSYLEQRLNRLIDLNQYDFFLECDSVR